MFDRIAHRYDLLNRLLSFGRDRAWRRRLVRGLAGRSAKRILDLATGTGDVLLAIAGHVPGVDFAIGVDPAAGMLDIARHKVLRRKLDNVLALSRGDALCLAFGNEVFDAVTIAFGIRNVPDVSAALREMARVLRPGGRLLIIEFSLPANYVVRQTYLLYFRHVLPWFGGLVSGNREAYRYLNRTAEAFPSGAAMCSMIEAAGFASVCAHALTWGVATLYEAEKPSS